MLKPLLIIGAIALVLGIALPTAAHMFKGGPNEATRLVDATSRTNSKANSLNDSFTDVIPPAPRATNISFPAGPGNAAINMIRKSPNGPRGQTQDAGKSLPGSPGNPANSGSPGNPDQPIPSATPDKYADYEHPSEHAVRDAMEFLHKLQTEMEPSPTQYIQAVESLQRAWSPRYNRAVEEYKRFAWRIDHADAMAKEYFQVQENLTNHITKSEDRMRAQQIDVNEREVYMDWRDQAFKTLGQARLIMVDLHDMNIIITKQSLSAHFAALYEEFHAIPPAITLLHQELEKFRAESDRIQATFGVSPK